MGSEIFIIVAFKCSDNRTFWFFATLNSCLKNAMSLLISIFAASIISFESVSINSLSIEIFPFTSFSMIFNLSGFFNNLDFSDEKKSPSSI